MKNDTAKKVGAQSLSELLTRDVHAILSVCIQHFDDSLRLSKEECFDVDAIISGRAHGSDNAYKRRVVPAAYARATREPSTITLAQKGYFIPQGRAYWPSFA